MYVACVHAKLCAQFYFKYSLPVLLQTNLHTKLDRGMLFTRQIFARECDVTSEQYRIKIIVLHFGLDTCQVNTKRA